MMDTSAGNEVPALTEGLNTMAASTITATASATTAVEREHLCVIEVETESGYRFWTAPMPESEANAYAKGIDEDEERFLSEFSCATSCWCWK